MALNLTEDTKAAKLLLSCSFNMTRMAKRKSVDSSSSKNIKKIRHTVNDRSYKGGYLETDLSFPTILPAGEEFHIRCGSNAQPDKTIVRIKNVLNEEQKAKFRNSCFGLFLDLPRCRFSGQLIHCLLLRKCKPCKYMKEVWFRLQSKVLRFSRTEFWISTGLKMTPDGEQVADANESSTSFRDKYFHKFSTIKYLESLVDCIGKLLPLPKKNNKKSLKKLKGKKKSKGVDDNVNYEDIVVDPDDAVMLCLLYFLECGLIGKAKISSIGKKAMLLACNWNAFNNYPWGDVVFSYLLDSLNRDYCEMQHSARELEAKKRRGQFKPGEDDRARYQIYGLGLAFQLWIYEAIPSIAREFARFSSDSFPKMLKWSSIVFPEFDHIQKILSKPGQSRVNTILSAEGAPTYPSLISELDYVLFDEVTLPQRQIMNANGSPTHQPVISNLEDIMLDEVLPLEEKTINCQEPNLDGSRERLAIAKECYKGNEEQKKGASEFASSDFDVLYKKLTGYFDEKFLYQQNLILSQQTVIERLHNDVQQLSSKVSKLHDNHYNNRKCANNTDIPSSDPGIDIGSSHILVKMPFLSPLKDTSTDSYTFDQLEHYTQVLHSGTMLRIEGKNETESISVSAQEENSGLQIEEICGDDENFDRPTYPYPKLPADWSKRFEDWYLQEAPAEIRLHYHGLVADKDSFFNPLKSEDGWLDSIHIDVILYELRAWKDRRPSIFGLKQYTTLDTYYSKECKNYLGEKIGISEPASKIIELKRGDRMVDFACGSGELGGMDYLAKDWKDLEVVYAPVNVDQNHWLCCAIYLKKRIIEIYDSLNARDMEEKCCHLAIMIPHVLHCLEYHGYGKDSGSDPYLQWPIIVVDGLPKQDNGFDCGIWCLNFIEFLIRGWTLDSINAIHFMEIRQRYCAQFICNNGKLNPDF